MNYILALTAKCDQFLNTAKLNYFCFNEKCLNFLHEILFNMISVLFLINDTNDVCLCWKIC